MITHTSYSSELAHYRNRYIKTLYDDIVPFWFPRCLDHDVGGYLTSYDRRGRLVDTDKSVWAQGRMSWMLSEMASGKDSSSSMPFVDWSELGISFLERCAFDTDGRMFFQLTRAGKPVRKRRYAYSEAFASIAYAARAVHRQSEGLATKARALFEHFVDWNFIPGAMPPKFTEHREMTGMGPRMIALVTARELADKLGDDEFLGGWRNRMIEEIARLFVKDDLEAVMESVGPKGELIDCYEGRLLNPGHALEGAWFVLKEADLSGRKDWLDLGLRMLSYMWKRGWDREYGGLNYFVDLKGLPVQEYWHEMKFWWPHNEAMVATLYAYVLTGQEKYWEWHKMVSNWSFEYLADPDFGEWFGYLRANGEPSSELKGNLWKSFFHLPRALLECIRLFDRCAKPQ